MCGQKSFRCCADRVTITFALSVPTISWIPLDLESAMSTEAVYSKERTILPIAQKSSTPTHNPETTLVDHVFNQDVPTLLVGDGSTWDSNDMFPSSPYPRDFPAIADPNNPSHHSLFRQAVDLLKDIHLTVSISSTFRATTFGSVPFTSDAQFPRFGCQIFHMYPPGPLKWDEDVHKIEKDLWIFVKELVRRSKTSPNVLVAALAYVAAFQDLYLTNQGLEKLLNNPYDNRGVEEFLEVSPAALASINANISSPKSSSPTKKHKIQKSKIPSKSLPPLPPMPSPLLCPRRVFLAALILSSKFLLERTHSNRAWAKVTGLGAREVSRCERALADALEWRLWEGKGEVSVVIPSGVSKRNISSNDAAVPPQPVDMAVPNDRCLVRGANKSAKASVNVLSNGLAYVASPCFAFGLKGEVNEGVRKQFTFECNLCK